VVVEVEDVEGEPRQLVAVLAESVHAERLATPAGWLRVRFPRCPRATSWRRQWALVGTKWEHTTRSPAVIDVGPGA